MESTAIEGSPGDRSIEHGDPPSVSLEPRPAGPSLRPALLVLGIAVGLVMTFGVLSVVFGSNHISTQTGSKQHPAGATKTRAPITGTALFARPARPTLRPIVHPDSPPPDVVDGLELPREARPLSHSTSVRTGGTGQFDASVTFSIGVPQETLITFYRHTLDNQGWKTFSEGGARGVKEGIEVLAQKAGSDGWYWEAGAVISPTTFHASPAGSTRFTLRLFQVPDPF